LAKNDVGGQRAGEAVYSSKKRKYNEISQTAQQFESLSLSKRSRDLPRVGIWSKKQHCSASLSLEKENVRRHESLGKGAVVQQAKRRKVNEITNSFSDTDSFRALITLNREN